MSRPLITVFGATSVPGANSAHGATSATSATSTTSATSAIAAALVRALLAEGPGGRRDFRVRAVTRRPGSSAARGLSDLGAEICAADIADTAALARALYGACGVFCSVDARHASALAAACSDTGPLVWAPPDAGQARAVAATFAARPDIALTVLVAAPPGSAQVGGGSVVVAATDIAAAAAALFRYTCRAGHAAVPAGRGTGP